MTSFNKLSRMAFSVILPTLSRPAKHHLPAPRGHTPRRLPMSRTCTLKTTRWRLHPQLLMDPAYHPPTHTPTRGRVLRPL